MADEHDASPGQPRTYGAAPWERPIAEPASYPELDESSSPPTWTPPEAAGAVHKPKPVSRKPRPASASASSTGPAPKPRPSQPAAPAPPPPSDSAPLSVAALLAREGRTTPSPRGRRRAKTDADDGDPEPAAPDTHPEPEPAGPEPPEPDPIDDTAVIAAVPAPADVPDLDAPAPTAEQATAPPPSEEKPRRTRRPMYFGRAAATFVAICALSLTGSAWQWNNVKNGKLTRVDALDPNSMDVRDPNAQYGDENFLVIGVDTRSGENSQMGAGDTSDAEGTRSDTIMLVNIPANRKRVAVVSFPRDLAITPVQCDKWDDDSKSYSSEKVFTETKLNSAFAYGGPKCLVKVIQKISGLSINRFLGVDFAGFSKMVDALGGVEVCSTTPLKDYELGTILENAGRQNIDGHTALQYVRARQVTTEYNGDYGRIKRQQLFLSSLLRTMISQNTFFSLKKLNNVVNLFIEDSYVDKISTKDLVDLGQSLQDVKAGRVTFLTVPTNGTDPEGNETPRPDDIRKIFDAIINDDPLPGELQPDGTRVPMPGTTSQHTTLVANETESGETPSPAPAPAAAPSAEQVDLVTTDPGDVSVRVSNSTGQNGLASSAASQLSQYGFGISAKDDYPVTLDNTTVFFAPGHEEQAATVAAAFGGARLQRVNGSTDKAVRVVLGKDFSTPTAPPAAGSPIQLQLTTGSMAPAELPVDLSVVNAADTTCE